MGWPTRFFDVAGNAGESPGFLFRVLPRKLRSLLTARLVDRFDRKALLRFQQEHWTGLNRDRAWQGGVAIVVPCYNHAVYLEATFESLAQQTYRPFEIVFVDDHSIDNTPALLSRFCQAPPADVHPTLVRLPRNGGQANALNQGIASSRQPVIVVHNDDDYLMHDALEATLEILRLNPDIFLFGATAIPFSGPGRPHAAADALFIRTSYPDYAGICLTRYTPADVRRFAHHNDINLTHSGSTFFRAAWEAAGGYYPDRSKRVVAYSDRDFQMRVASLFPVAVSATAPFAYWRTDSSVDRGRNT